MSLEKYKQKRRFDKTPEPSGGNPTGNKLRFVVQKHHASHLHYDFRLELRGILKSWAVPKGLSMNPSESRLAMLVEDHPWDYRDFEGVIPSGYGAGTVIVWDEGTYETQEINEKDKKAQEHSITSQFWKGQVKFVLHGYKLKGAFQISRAKDKGDNSWYIHKVKDRYATNEDITEMNKSVISHKTLEQVAANPKKEWESHKASKKKKSDTGEDLQGKGTVASKTPMPEKVKPMLCTLLRAPFQDDRYLYELKLDGYRIIAYKLKSSIRMGSRSGLDYTSKYPIVSAALKKLKHDVVLDGEMIVLNKKGHADFDALQKYNGQKTPIVFSVFDLIWMDGYDLKGFPLTNRKQLLEDLLKDNSILRFTQVFDDGLTLYKQAQEKGTEGIVAKRKDSIYIENDRSSNWYKIPTTIRQEFVIGAWAESERGRAFRSLLFGAYNDKRELEWIGRSGGGYKEKDMPGILKRLKELEISSSPFVNKILDTKGATIHYVKPVLVANFQFATWTMSGRIRKPATFLGFRKDKNAKQVVREIAKKVESDDNGITTKRKFKKALTTSTESNWPEIEKQKITSEATFNLGTCDIQIQNIEREIWKAVTKAELIQYYHSVAPYILPHLQDRALSLHVKLVNANAPGLYIKDMEGRQPACADIFTDERRHAKKGKRDVIDYLVCNNEETLLYMINLGCIDVNPWTSRVTDKDYPDYIIIDLDPSDADFSKAIKTAVASRKLFDKYKLEAFIKTSGKTGIHIYIPCQSFTFTEARKIATTIGKEIHALLPEITTTDVTVSKRGNKLYIDPNQNDYADTVAAPYSARPFHVPTVSTPLAWKEVTQELNPSKFTIHTIAARLKKKGDLFQSILDEKMRIRNSKILKRFI